MLLGLLLLGSALGASPWRTRVDELPQEVTLNRLNTLYWLGRARPWSLYEPEEAIREAAAAERAAMSPSQLERLDALQSQAEFELAEREGQLGAASIVFGLLSGADQVIEWVDDPRDVAIERALDGLFGAGSRIPLVGQQLVLVTRLGENALAAGFDESAREVMDAWLNANTRAYVLADHEQLAPDGVVDGSEIDRLRRLAGQFGGDRVDLDHIGVVEIEFNDLFDEIWYVSGYFRKLDVATGEWGGEYYADGFAQSTRGGLAVALLIAMIGGIPLVPALAWLFRRSRLDPRRELNSAPAPSWWLGPAAVAGGFVFAFLVRSGFVAAEPDLTMPMTSIVARAWAFGTPLALLALPVVVVYVLAPRIPGVAGLMRHGDAVATLLIGAWLGAQCHLLGHAISVLGTPAAITAMLGPTLAGMCSLGFLAHRWCRWQSDGDRRDAITAACAGLALLVVVLAEFRLEGDGLLVATLAPFIPIGLGEVATALAVRRSSRDVGVLKPNTLRDNLRTPDYIETGAIRVEFARVREHLIGEASFDPAIEVVWIAGDRGSGKTRFAEELATQVSRAAREGEAIPEILVALGDCCEPGDPAGEVPFKPFRQALGELLGLGRFTDPTAQSRKLQAGLTRLAGNTVVGGALSLALDLGDDGGDDKANLAVVAEQILNAMVARVIPSHTDEDGCRILLILDDVQWMDDESFRLFRILLHRLASRFVEEERLWNRVAIILTARTDCDEEHVTRSEEILSVLESLGKEGTVDLLKITSFERLLSGDEVSSEWLDAYFDAVNATPRARRQIGARLDSGRVRPLDRLEFISLALEQGLVRERHGRLDVVPGTSLDSLDDVGSDFDEMVRREIDGLDARLVEILHCAAVIGREFRPSVLARIFHLDELELLSLLRQAEERRIVVDDRATDDLHRFHDKRIAGVFRAAGGAGRDDLRQMVREYHARYVEARQDELARTGQDASRLPLSEIAQLAHHASMVADRLPVAAIIWGDRAAARAERERLWGRALQLIGPAVRLVRRESFGLSESDRIAVLTRHARIVLAAEEGLDDASDSVAFAMSLSGTKAAKADLANLASLLAYRRHDSVAAEAHAREALSLSEPDTAAHLRARFHELISRPRRASADLEALLRDTRRAQASEAPVPLIELESEILNTLGWTCLYGDDDPSSAATAFERALELNRDSRLLDRKGEAISLGGLGDVWMRRSRDGSEEAAWEEAARCYAANLAISEQDGDQRGVATMHSKLGGIALDRVERGGAEPGTLESAVRHYEMSLDVAARVRDAVGMRFAMQGLARAAAMGGLAVEAIVDQLPDLEGAGFDPAGRDAVAGFVTGLRDRTPDEEARVAMAKVLLALESMFRHGEPDSSD